MDTPTPVADDIEIESSAPVADAVASSPAPPEVSVAATQEADDTRVSDPGDEDPQPDEKPAAKAVKSNSIQARIDKAVAAQREAERRADALEVRMREYEARTSRPASREPQAPAAPTYRTRPEPTEDEVGSKYQSYGDFVKDHGKWVREEIAAESAERDQRRAMAQRHETHAAKFVEKIAAAEQTDPEFWSKIDPAVANLRPSSALMPGERPNALNAIADMIFDSDHSTELMARLRASDLQRLSTLPPAQLFREMGRLEASVMRPAAASSGPAPRTPAISQAPPPIKPVGTSAHTGEVDPLSDDLDVDEHIRVMNARDRKGRFTSR